MRLIALTLAALALMLAAPSVGAWGHDNAAASHTTHYYTLWNAHRDDVNAEGWQASYSMTDTTCESATVTTLIMADRDGWPIDAIVPVVLDMERVFPNTSPCSITLGIR